MKLSEKETKTILLAFHYATQDREGLLDAYAHCTGAEAMEVKRATKAQIKRFENLRKKLGGRKVDPLAGMEKVIIDPLTHTIRG